MATTHSLFATLGTAQIPQVLRPPGSAQAEFQPAHSSSPQGQQRMDAQLVPAETFYLLPQQTFTGISQQSVFRSPVSWLQAHSVDSLNGYGTVAAVPGFLDVQFNAGFLGGQPQVVTPTLLQSAGYSAYLTSDLARLGGTALGRQQRALLVDPAITSAVDVLFSEPMIRGPQPFESRSGMSGMEETMRELNGGSGSLPPIVKREEPSLSSLGSIESADFRATPMPFSPNEHVKEEEGGQDDQSAGPTRKGRSTARARNKPLPKVAASSRTPKSAPLTFHEQAGDKEQNGRIKRHRCRVCSSRFFSLGHLSRHVKIHLPPEQKPHSCPVEGCDRRFARSDNMRVHYKIHMKKIHGDGWTEPQ